MDVAPLPVETLRAEFPAFEREIRGRPAAFFDGPAGSQVPQRVADAVRHSLLHANANQGGFFATSRECGEMMAAARRSVAELLGTPDPDTVVFGPNMTTLTFQLSRALARTWREGDEVVVTRAEHDANFTPWVLAARDAGASVREVGVRSDGRIDIDGLRAAVGERTRLVAVGAASNALGTLQPVDEAVETAHAAGARVFVDAVHLAPHRRLDIAGWGCDFVSVSAYKVFGPHVGLLCGTREALESVQPYKVRPAADRLPDAWMQGTQNHEGIAGVAAAVEYLADIGRRVRPQAVERPAALDAAFRAIGTHEETLTSRLLEGLARIDDVQVLGIADPERVRERVATVSFLHARHPPEAVAQRLAERGIFVWSGDVYARPLAEALGLGPEGLVRAGLLHYHDADDVDWLLEALEVLPR